MRLKVQLLTVAGAFCAATGWSEDKLGKTLFGDGRRLGRLRGRSDMASGRVEDALRWLSGHWPEGAAWPGGVPRPEPRSGE